jgi:hypothetical protein
MFLPSELVEMKIGLVIHGPEVIDSGEAKKIFEKLSCMGKVEAKLGGAMGKTAVLDAGLEGIIDVSRHLKPSVWIESLFESSDLVFLLNRGKTIETGRVFGEMVAAQLNRQGMKPLILIESPESVNGKLIPLNKKAEEWMEKLSEIFRLPAENLQPFNNPVYLEECPETDKTKVIRKLAGVFPGENILVNGIVIGKALSSKISIVSENGFIVAIRGGEIKEHGLEKLHHYDKRDPIDLGKAWIKSGTLRRNDPFTLQAQKQIVSSRIPGSVFRQGTGKVVFIDHTAEFVFELAVGTELAVTVGDDTTAIAGYILSRLGIPIFGITDGDCDDLVCQTRYFPGSIVLRLTAGKDDIIGKKLKDEFFRRENSIILEDIYSFKKDVMKLAEPVIEAIIEY